MTTASDLEAGGKRHRGDLRLVADLDQEEGDQRRQEGAGLARRLRALVGLVGIRHQPAMTMKVAASTQRIVSGPTQAATAAPIQAASAWLARAAQRMPRMIGTGLRYRAASIRARSCVLSPISATATRAVETKNASIGAHLHRKNGSDKLP